MTAVGPDAPYMQHTPLTERVRERLAEKGWEVEDRVKPRIHGGATRSTLYRYTQPGNWLRTGLKTDTVRALARSLDLPEPEVQRLVVASIDAAKAEAVDRHRAEAKAVPWDSFVADRDEESIAATLSDDVILAEAAKRLRQGRDVT